MSGIHDIRSGSLTQVIQLANCRAVIETLIKRRIVLEGMELQCNFGWNSLGLGVIGAHILDN